MMKTLISNVDTITSENRVYRTEVRELREEIKNRDNKWSREKEKLENKILDLEDKIEKQVKDKKKNNIIIKGLVV